MAIKLNYMKLDKGVIMQKEYSNELLINGFSFFTESKRILGGGGLWAYLKGGRGGLNRIVTVFSHSSKVTLL